LAAWNEAEVDFEVICSSSGVEDESANAHRFFERHPRVQGSSYPGDKRVLCLCIERLAFQIERDTRAVSSDFDRDRSNNLSRALALSRMFPERAGRACLGCAIHG
jgi:hypothetical protein